MNATFNKLIVLNILRLLFKYLGINDLFNRFTRGVQGGGGGSARGDHGAVWLGSVNDFNYSSWAGSSFYYPKPNHTRQVTGHAGTRNEWLPTVRVMVNHSKKLIKSNRTNNIIN